MNRRIQPEILLRGDGWILFFYKWDFIKDFIKDKTVDLDKLAEANGWSKTDKAGTWSIPANGKRVWNQPNLYGHAGQTAGIIKNTWSNP